MKAVKVKWVDAESTTEWTTLEELKDPEPVHTLGYLVKETEEFYFVAASVFVNESKVRQVGDTIAIPKRWTIELFEIKDAPKKTSRRTKTS